MRSAPALVLPLLCGLALGASGRPARAAEPVLERVLLSTGGVGYLGYRAEPGPDGEVRLRVPLRQVDDILKSLTVLDADGKVKAVSLLGPTPLADIFRGAPFEEADLADLPSLLTSLRGAELELRGPAAVRGRLLSVAAEETVQGEARTVRHRVGLLTDEGIRSAILEDVEAVALASPELDQRVQLVLGRLADNQLDQERELAITLEGAAGSTVGLGYLAEMPLWKASYRLVVAGDRDGLLQGWAILENLSGQDWREVDVTLIAGSPTALRQALFQSYFVPRPEVPVLPEPAPGPTADTAPLAMAAPMAAKRGADGGSGVEAAEAAGPAPLAAAATAELTAQTLFHLAHPVSLPVGHTVMAPLVDRQVPLERLVLYRAAAGGRHPLAALRVRNATAASLPAGIATLYERVAEAGSLTYLGDATLPQMAPGTEELLGYGLDANVEVARREEETSRLVRASIADGILQLARVEQRRATYQVTARFDGAPRSFVLEQPVEPGWEVVEPAGAKVERDVARVRRELPARSTLDVTVVSERPLLERIELADAAPEGLLLQFEGGAPPPELRAVLERLQALSARIAGIDRQIEEAEARRAERVAEQERLRANLEAVPPESDLARRYLDRLGGSEDELTELSKQLEALRAERERASEERRAFLRSARV